MSTLEELSLKALARNPVTPAIEWDSKWVSWGELRRIADKVNGLIDASGADPHAPIAFVPRNRPSAVASLIGMNARGRHISMVYVFQSPAGISRAISQLKPAVVLAFAEDLSADVLATLCEQGIAAVSLSESDASAVPGYETSTIICDPQPSRPQINILTSGTTGPPKLFALGYDLIARDIVGMNVMNTNMVIDPETIPPIQIFYPFSNISGIYSSLPVLLHGIRGILLDRFSLSAWHEYMLKYRPQAGGLPAAALQMVLDAGIPPEDLSSIRYMQTGAAAIDPTTRRLFEERYGVPILTSYGATEFGGPVTMMTPDLIDEWYAKKPGTVGRPYAGASLRATDPVTGAVLPPGEEGILEVIAPRMGPDWIRTSDLGVVDADGFVFHHGRADGAIVRGGFKLLPETIETALMLHDAVSFAGVVGKADRRLGQVPVVAIQLNPAMPKPGIEDLEKHLREHVLATHIPVEWRFIDAMPMTPSLKVDRGGVKRLFDIADSA